MSIIMQDKSFKTYIVLGMHKGGTSFISKALKSRGVDMGIIDKKHYEGKKFREFNQKILKEAGGSAIDPPTKEAIKQAVLNHANELKTLIKSRKKDFWGFKDPQSALTIEPMLPFFEDDVYLICVFRKPKKVAESLSSRGNITRQKSKKLTLNYYNSILDTIKTFLTT